MATIFALILLPAVIAVVALVGSTSGSAAGAFVGVATVALLAGSMVYGLLRMTRTWEQGEQS